MLLVFSLHKDTLLNLAILKSYTSLISFFFFFVIRELDIIKSVSSLIQYLFNSNGSLAFFSLFFSLR